MKNFFVAGIGTGIGKSLVSAILCEALEADYWKPVQAGTSEVTDSNFVRELVRNGKTVIHKEAFSLSTPCSPHLAAEIDGVKIKVKDIVLPKSFNSMIIEGAGGLLVPLNQQELVIDLISQLKSEVILVSKNYLGSINHTLLSVEALNSRSIPIVGIVFNGPHNPQTESIILSFSKLPVIGRVLEETAVNQSVVSKYAIDFKRSLSEFI